MKKILMLMALSLIGFQLKAENQIISSESNDIQPIEIAETNNDRPKVIVVREKFRPQDLRKELTHVRPNKKSFFDGLTIFVTGFTAGIFAGILIFANLIGSIRLF